MPTFKRKPGRWSDARIERFLDPLKDEIDELHRIPNNNSRVRAARDLIAYIELHHLQGSSHG